MKTKTEFTPELIVPNGVTDISFYSKAFNAVELWRLNNDNGSIHVAGLSIDGAVFHIHERTAGNGGFADITPAANVIIGLMVNDVHKFVAQAETAGATVLSPVQDYEYGYRQGSIKDPFGHHWTIQKIINPEILTTGNYGK